MFDKTDPEQAEAIRQMLKEGQVPWNMKLNTPMDANFAQLNSLVKSCCHPDPSLRPPMASVAQSLFMILSCADILAPPLTPDANGIKLRVKEALDVAKVDKQAQYSDSVLNDKDCDTLRTLVRQGDPVASALLGGAIWRQLVEYQTDGEFVYVSLGNKEEETGEDAMTVSETLRLPFLTLTENRAKLALPFLEFAAQSGVNSAYSYLADIHKVLAKLYHGLRKGHQGTGS